MPSKAQISLWPNDIFVLIHPFETISRSERSSQTHLGSGALQITRNYSLPGQQRKRPYWYYIASACILIASQPSWISYPWRINLGYNRKMNWPSNHTSTHYTYLWEIPHNIQRETNLEYTIHQVWEASITHCQTFSSPVPSPVKNKPPGPVCIALISSLANILPLSLNL